MKRSVPVALVLVMLCVFPVFAGCGEEGDVDGARRLVKSGDAKYKTFSAEFLELADLLEKFFATYAQGVNTAPEEADESMRAFGERLQKLLEQVKQAKEPYRKVLEMGGVKQYKEYAKLKLKMLDKIDRSGDVVSKTFQIIEKDVRTGKTPDANVLEASKRELIGIEMEISFFEAEADQLAKDKKLTR